MRRLRNCPCEATAGPVRDSSERAGIWSPEIPPKPSAASSAERGGASDLWPFGAEGSDTKPAPTTNRRKSCRSFGDQAATSARSAGRPIRVKSRTLCRPRKLCFRRQGKHSAWLSAPHFAALGGGFAGRSPCPLASTQSSLCLEHPAGIGIPRAALLRLSSKRNPLRWASV